MATRKTGVRRKSPARRTNQKTGRVSASTIFWILFLIAIIITCFTFLPKLTEGGKTQQKETAQEQAPQKPTASEQKPEDSPQPIQPEKAPEKPPATPPTPAQNRQQEKKPAEKPAGQTRPQPDRQQPTRQQQSQPDKPQQTTSQQSTGQQAASQPQPVAKPAETSDRSIYLVRDDADLSLVKVSRKLRASDSPLLDCLNALLSGPTAEEKNRNLVSLVPPGTRILSAQVRKNTVYLNFNEEFRYNTFGREGSAAQLKQIVWTATEFSNVHNVQIQIEGETVDFLVEGIPIRNPIGR
jgi:spore germination protein GerM